MKLTEEWQRLRQLEWRELDVREASGWPWSLQVVCCLVVLALTFTAVRWYLVLPKKDVLVEARHQEASLLHDYQQQMRQAGALPTMQAQADEREQRLAGLLDMLPPAVEEVPRLIDAISEAAVANQLSIGFIRPGVPHARAFYVEYPFDLQVSGNYHDIAAFLADMAGLAHIVTQHDFTLEPQDGLLPLQLTMQARTYSEQRDVEELP